MGSSLLPTPAAGDGGRVLFCPGGSPGGRGGAMFAESQDEDQIIERVAALDIGTAEVVCCVRLPGPGRRRVQEVTAHSTMVGS